MRHLLEPVTAASLAAVGCRGAHAGTGCGLRNGRRAGWRLLDGAHAAVADGRDWLDIRDRQDDRPVHLVSLDAFSIDRHEVTNGEYAAYVKVAGATAPYHWGGAAPAAAKATLPVYNVSWHEAAAYCAWRGARLPTEAEWEKAARGGEADSDYPWGNEYESEEGAKATPSADEAGANSGAPAARPARVKRAQSSSAGGPRPVGSFEPNRFGLYDMSGNVWEWVADWYDLYYYGVSPIQNPRGPAQGRYKVIRGGSWADTDPRLGAGGLPQLHVPGRAHADDWLPLCEMRGDASHLSFLTSNFIRSDPCVGFHVVRARRPLRAVAPGTARLGILIVDAQVFTLAAAAARKLVLLLSSIRGRSVCRISCCSSALP